MQPAEVLPWSVGIFLRYEALVTHAVTGAGSSGCGHQQRRQCSMQLPVCLALLVLLLSCWLLECVQPACSVWVHLCVGISRGGLLSGWRLRCMVTAMCSFKGVGLYTGGAFCACVCEPVCCAVPDRHDCSTAVGLREPDEKMQPECLAGPVWLCLFCRTVCVCLFF